MSTRKQMQTIFVDVEAGLDVSWPDGTQAFCKDTAKLWVLNNGTYTLISSGATTFNPEGWTTIVKSVNQDVTNTATTNDDEFFFSVTAGNSYLVDMSNAVSCNDTTGSIRGFFGVDSGVMSGSGYYAGPTTAVAFSVAGQATSGTFQMASIGTGVNLDWVLGNKISFAFTPTATTTFRFKFGNNSAGAGRISRVWKGSIMKYKNLN